MSIPEFVRFLRRLKAKKVDVSRLTVGALLLIEFVCANVPSEKWPR